MTKTSTKKRPNRKPAATAALAAVVTTKKRLTPGNTSRGQPRKKTRKSVSHQQTIQARDTLDAEYRDWRTATTSVEHNLQPPNVPITTTPMTEPQAAGLGSLVEQSVQDLAGILSAM